MEESRKTVSCGDDHRDRGASEALLGVAREAEATVEGVLVTGDRRQYRAAVGAAGEPATLELVEVAPRRHRRNSEARLDRCDGDRAGGEQQVADQAPAVLRNGVLGRRLLAWGAVVLDRRGGVVTAGRGPRDILERLLQLALAHIPVRSDMIDSACKVTALHQI